MAAIAEIGVSLRFALPVDKGSTGWNSVLSIWVSDSRQRGQSPAGSLAANGAPHQRANRPGLHRPWGRPPSLEFIAVETCSLLW